LKNDSSFGWVAGGDDVESHEAEERAECDATRKGRRFSLFVCFTKILTYT